MSWFDKLFGESKENTEDIRTERLDTSENDVYRRPRGKFRFPVDVDTVKTRESHPTTHEKPVENSDATYKPVQKKRNRQSATFDETYVPRRQRRAARDQHVGYKVETSPLGRKQSDEAQIEKAHRVHQPKFKASEVPSAIYGTKSRKDPSLLKGRPPIVPKKVTASRPATPTHRKEDNAVNIENVYASQIVAEIRKERDKKIQRQKAFQEERRKLAEQQEAIKSMMNHEPVEQEVEEEVVLEVAADDVVQLSDDVITLSDEAVVTDIEIDTLDDTPIKVNISDEGTEVDLNSGESYTFSSREDETFMEENITFESTDTEADESKTQDDIIDTDTDIDEDDEAFEDVLLDEDTFDDVSFDTEEDTEMALNDEPPASLEPVLAPDTKKEKVTPFNVVMTPSDKKRLMQQRAASKSERTEVQQLSNEPVEDVQEQQPDGLSEPKETEDEAKLRQFKRKGPKYLLPPVSLLTPADNMERDESWVEEHKAQLDDAFYHFNVPAKVENVVVGPSVTRFELSVEKGVKVSRITNLQDDIKMALAAKDVRIEAPIPGTSLVGVEVPNVETRNVNLSEIVFSKKMKFSDSNLSVALGARINNEPMIMDLAKMPHGLIAGATGSGKSVCINSILISLLYRNNPNELKLLLIDPKMVELAPYNDLPHLIAPVITDVKAATESLKWVVGEMERRYQIFADVHVRNITAYNQKVSYQDRIPKIVVVIDELADLMMMAPQDVEHSIARIAQKARAAGIHLILATQRPSVNVITGLIKANVPTRIAFMVSSSVDSRTILDSGGAEKLLGNGDMLYLGNGMNKPIRIQGSYISDREIDEVVGYIKSQGKPNYLFHEKTLLKKLSEQPKDELFNEICNFMVEEGHISTSQIQRRFQIGYNRAARIIDQLEEMGYVSGQNGSKPRDVLITEKQEEY
ncbi:DNA translocase FtsK [Macrococcoides canis]|uniref:DNA translocase FtsK n=1 Tax=Macrococcoides canis TaxID=1855823 RepID=UPI001B8C88B9|nr:DNA translocase FtsK [Macrococcus canis]QUR95232.1 DNA translocase FtsK [Macrococcus canis]UTH06220.1 DNA translocase FtsK [Macrococcus canis]